MEKKSPRPSQEELLKLFGLLLPACPFLLIERIEPIGEQVVISLVSTQQENACPWCGTTTKRVHSRYERLLHDLPLGSFCVRLRVQVHRWFCQNPACSRQIFTERLPHLAAPSARRTARQQEALLHLGWVLGGEAGARLSCHHQMPVCAATLLTLLRRSPDVPAATPRVLGVDDWGLGMVHPSGTLLVDLETHHPVDLLLGSDDQVLMHWLTAHPGVEIISRDRGASYAHAIAQAVPEVKQVLDRWHLLKNASEVMQRTVAQHIEVLRHVDEELSSQRDHQPEAPVPIPDPPPVGAPVKKRKPPRRVPKAPSQQRAWQYEMFEQVKLLASEGIGVNETARRLHLAKKTVRKYRRLEQLVDQRENPGGSYVEPYREYLERRWAQGPVSIKTLWRELQAQGFAGGYNSVWRFVREWPLPEGSQPTLTPLPTGRMHVKRLRVPRRSPFRVAKLLSCPSEELSGAERTYRETVCRLSPQLALAADLLAQFKHLMSLRIPEDVPAWLEKAKDSHLEAFRRFALGLENEQDAFIAALTEPWSTAQVEGQITRLKLIKRQGYGRAKIDLLRLRVLHPT